MRRFSLRGLLCFHAVAAVWLSLNVRQTFTHGGIFLSLALPPGQSQLQEAIHLERGFPFPYQQTFKAYPRGRLTSLEIDYWRSSAPLVVTQPWALAGDIACGAALAACSFLNPSSRKTAH